MDVIGQFDPPSKQGNKFALTVICMHTGFAFWIPTPNKSASTIVKAYMNNVYCWFGGSYKILTDNGTEFKNDLINQVAKELGVEHKIFTPPISPTIQWKNRGFPLFPKSLYSKTYQSAGRMG